MPLDFDAKLYTATALRETARAFAKVARVIVRRQGERYLVRVEPLPGHGLPPNLNDELGNYALGLAAQARR
ncbi:MAG: HxsD-like protein [Myxococcota bacterium]